MKSDAQLWLQLFKDEDHEITWENFESGLHVRFGLAQNEDFFGDLTKLHQIGTMIEYQTQFEKLLVQAE